MEWKKVFIEKKAWSEEVMMYLTSLALKKGGKPLYTTQFFTFDGVTVTWMVLAFIVGVVIGKIL
jgi:hypothetical protein